MSSTIISGARVRFAVPELGVMAYASGVTGGEQITWSPVDVLGMLKVLEHVATAYTANMTAAIFRRVDKSIKQIGIMPKYGNDGKDILTSGVLSAIIEDILTGKIIAKAVGVRVSENRFDIASRGVVTSNVTMVCTQMMDESETSA